MLSRRKQKLQIAGAKKKTDKLQTPRSVSVATTRQYVPESIAQQIIPKGGFSSAGGAIGGLFGPMGAAAGSMLGKGLAHIVGFGDYTVSSNSLTTTGGTLTDSVPKFSSNGNTFRVSHREYIGDIIAPATPAAYNSNAYLINPGNATSFPWLYTVARNFQEYNFKGCVYEFKTSTSDYASGGALGTVIMATNYNVMDLPYTNKVTMENSDFACSSKPSLSLLHPIECDPTQRPTKLLMVRDANDAANNNDPRFYDFARLQVATVGLSCSPGVVLGELWVTYDVELLKPKISNAALGLTQVISISSANYGVGCTTGAMSTTTTLCTNSDNSLAGPNPYFRLSQSAGAPYSTMVEILRPCQFMLTRRSIGTFTTDTVTGWSSNVGTLGGAVTDLLPVSNYANSSTRCEVSYWFDAPLNCVGCLVTVPQPTSTAFTTGMLAITIIKSY